jgi:hypothetical protein
MSEEHITFIFRSEDVGTSHIAPGVRWRPGYLAAKQCGCSNGLWSSADARKAFLVRMPLG